MRAAPVTPFVQGPRARLWLVVRFLLGASALVALVFVLVRTARPQLEQLGSWFVERFGVLGVGLGTLLADGFHCPIPPQFYMLLSIAAGTPAGVTLVATGVASLSGGVLGFGLSRKLGRLPRVARFIERISGRAGHALSHKYAYRSVLLLSITPMAFSVLCYLAGLHGMRRGPFMLLLALRIPKLVLYYYLVALGWSAP